MVPVNATMNPRRPSATAWQPTIRTSKPASWFRPPPRPVKTKKAKTPASSNSIPVDSGLADFFLVTSAPNDRQALAIADEIEHRLKRELRRLPNSVEGRRQGEWILLDYVDFVVHVFLAERRAFYDIERLRKSARPLTPAEFDEELKHALAEKTRAARKRAGKIDAGGERRRSARSRPPRRHPRAGRLRSSPRRRSPLRGPGAGSPPATRER